MKVATPTALPAARGTSHKYKANTNCSKRSRAYANKGTSEQETAETSSGQKGQHVRDKWTKLRSLKRVEPSPNKAVSTKALQNRKKKFVYSATTDRKKGFICVSELDIVDEPKGAFMMDSEKKDIVFVLLPRKAVLDATGNKAPAVISALEKLQDTMPNTERSPQRHGDCDGNYNTVGVRADRAGPGTAQSKFAESNKQDWNTLVKMNIRCKELALEYLPTGVLRGASQVLAMSKCATMAKSQGPNSNNKAIPDKSPLSATKGKGKLQTLFAAMANAINHWSRAHTDMDFFLSALTVNVKDLVTRDNPTYSIDSPVVHHFIFPEYGKAVALRAGDTLLFSPLHFHCLSQKETHYNGSRVMVTSFYLKTAVVCKNDNRIPLTQEEHDLLGIF
jgi:hypothetical protein